VKIASSNPETMLAFTTIVEILAVLVVIALYIASHW